MSNVDDTPAEVGWFYRRWYTFISSVILYILLGGCIVWMGINAQPLMWVALALVLAQAVLQGLYLGGASILDYAKLAQGISDGLAGIKTTIQGAITSVEQKVTGDKQGE